MSERAVMREATTGFRDHDPVDPVGFREAVEELGFAQDGWPEEGVPFLIEELGDLGISAWNRYVNLVEAIDAGDVAELLRSREDGLDDVPHALVEAAAVATMDPETLMMDRAELFREAMRRLSAGPVCRLFDDEAA